MRTFLLFPFLLATLTLAACSSSSSASDSCTEKTGDGGTACTVGGSPAKSFTCSGEAKPASSSCELRATVTINGAKTTSYCCL